MGIKIGDKRWVVQPEAETDDGHTNRWFVLCETLVGLSRYDGDFSPFLEDWEETEAASLGPFFTKEEAHKECSFMNELQVSQ